MNPNANFKSNCDSNSNNIADLEKQMLSSGYFYSATGDLIINKEKIVEHMGEAEDIALERDKDFLIAINKVSDTCGAIN
jgi:hypothetical protein